MENNNNDAVKDYLIKEVIIDMKRKIHAKGGKSETHKKTVLEVYYTGGHNHVSFHEKIGMCFSQVEVEALMAKHKKEKE